MLGKRQGTRLVATRTPPTSVGKVQTHTRDEVKVDECDPITVTSSYLRNRSRKTDDTAPTEQLVRQAMGKGNMVVPGGLSWTGT